MKEDIPCCIYAGKSITIQNCINVNLLYFLPLAVSEAYSINTESLSTNDCITVTLNPLCIESVTLFTPQLVYGLCTSQRDTYINFTGTFDSATNSTCLPLSILGKICYEVSLSYNGVVLDGSAQNGTYSFSGCITSQLDTLTAQSRVTYTPDCSESSPGILPHGTSVTFACGSCNTLIGLSQLCWHNFRIIGALFG